jgi:hypothetical protein
MRLMILENRRLRKTLQPGPGMISIGSAPSCAVHLPDSRICAHQASLSQDTDGIWWLEVVDTTIPTCLNRAVQKNKAKLRHADEIELGSFSIRLLIETDADREEIQRQRMLAITRQHGEGLPLESIIQRFEQPVSVSKEHLEQTTLLVLRLAQAENVPELLPPILRAALRTFSGKRAWIGVRSSDRNDFDWSLAMTAAGQPCDRPQFSVGMQTRILSHNQYLCVSHSPAVSSASAMAAPLVAQSGTSGMLYVENDPGDPAYDESSLHALAAFSCCVALPVANVLRKAIVKRQTVVDMELVIARATQDALTPKALPQWPELQVATYRHMGTARCCDIWDIVQLADKTAALVVARLHMSGLAVPRYLTEVRSAFRIAALHSEAPHLLCRALNWMIHDGEGRTQIDLVCAWINPQNGKLQYCRAGGGVHIGKITSRTQAEWWNDGSAEPLGRSKAIPYELQKHEILPGESIFLVTSGIEQVRNRESAALGVAGFEDNICDGMGASLSQTLGEFAKDLSEYIQGGACPEDVTVVMIKR